MFNTSSKRLLFNLLRLSMTELKHNECMLECLFTICKAKTVLYIRGERFNDGFVLTISSISLFKSGKKN